MYGKGLLTKQELECFEMFQLHESGASQLILKTNLKKWEYKLYGGRPEFYPQDRKALLTMIQFRNDKNEHDRKRAEKQQKMKQYLSATGGGGGVRGIGSEVGNR